MSPQAKRNWLAILGLVVIVAAYELYKPLGIALAVIAIVTMFLRGKQ